ncbi:TPA: glutathione S-transferase family protein [Haemophilus influenzae]|uniref:glutathione S-transferase family protein n=1 Tax=Haemophilus influenzae TaxID=727 RepID=UPI000039ADA1|nr:glutathione S-transferase family protein [Haemophilus influenzae]ADO80452.1 Putative glutathione-S-transferase [Haemophilus influenzae R2866]EDK11320.1 glutathione S-transferase [Haemophilus influenzae PittII]KMZ20120.1 glutathione S-transferase [Haemophilus influenzae]MCK8950537.1 glutathione S-transferase family protein [Haemophilus influenzae]MCK8959236.1 glutathione S-transferase family protein [Haemophilus influenzae]
MKLYGLIGACSFVPHVALEWVKIRENADYEFEPVTRELIKSPEFLSLNPRGAVPVLVDGDLVLSQNQAIFHYLDELYPNSKLFGSKTVRDKAKAARWLAFFNSDVHKSFVPLFRLPNYAKDNETLAHTIRQQAVEQILDQLAVANEHLESHIYFGEAISVADVYLYIMLNWCRAVGIDFSHLTQLSAFMQRVETDQAVENVRKIEELKA